MAQFYDRLDAIVDKTDKLSVRLETGDKNPVQSAPELSAITVGSTPIARKIHVRSSSTDPRPSSRTPLTSVSTEMTEESRPEFNQELQPEEGPNGLDSVLWNALFDPKNRMFVLRLEKALLALLRNNSLQSIQLDPMNSFYRMVCHKVAEYYDIGHTASADGSSVVYFKLAKQRVPPTRLADIESGGFKETVKTTYHSPKKRALILKKDRDEEQPESEGDKTPENYLLQDKVEELEVDDMTPGSSDGDNDGSSAGLKGLSFEARVAAYEQARARIFKNFDEDGDEPDIEHDETAPVVDSEYSREYVRTSTSSVQLRRPYSAVPHSNFSDSQLYSKYVDYPIHPNPSTTAFRLPSPAAYAAPYPPYPYYEPIRYQEPEPKPSTTKRTGSGSAPLQFHGQSFMPRQKK